MNYYKASRTPLREFVIPAQTELNLFDSSHTVFFFMCSEPTDPPTELWVSKVDSTKANIHWKPVDLNSVQGEFKEYRVRLAAFL